MFESVKLSAKDTRRGVGELSSARARRHLESWCLSAAVRVHASGNKGDYPPPSTPNTKACLSSPI